MELAEITPKLLDVYLNLFRQGREKPADFLSLHCVDFPATRDIEEKHVYLYTWLETLVKERLTHYRDDQNKSIKYLALGWQQALQYDFQNNNINLQAWSALYYRYFSGESDSFDALAQAAASDPRQFRRRLENGLKELVNLLQRSEMEAHQQGAHKNIGRSIPIPDYNHLFGVQKARLQIYDWLTRESGPQMVSVEGIGGIGKTSLTQSTLEHLMENDAGRFRDLVWISARQDALSSRGEIESLSRHPSTINEIVSGVAQELGLSNVTGLNLNDRLEAIRHLLALYPYLIAIDNLEKVDEVRTLVPMFRKIAGKARFIFTSRRTLGAFPYVQIFPVPQLSEQDSSQLIESEINRLGNIGYQLSPANAAKIFTTVGGLPLALKLIAAQIFDLSEEYILKRLDVFSTGKSHRALYTYIYRETWKNLELDAQHLLLSMLLVSPNGDSLEWIQSNSGLSSIRFEKAFTQLLDFSLIEINRRTDQRGYYLHRLTYTFLKSNILDEWNG